ncbi:MAG TPA: hypothetical protein VGG19_20635 [Tepidisphaeraceae bacterium]|jgi:hypothetical protein
MTVCKTNIAPAEGCIICNRRACDDGFYAVHGGGYLCAMCCNHITEHPDRVICLFTEQANLVTSRLNKLGDVLNEINENGVTVIEVEN